MRFVAIKSVEQQAARGVERARELLIKQRTQLRNCRRSQLAEFGIVAAPGGRGFAELSALVAADDTAIPVLLRPALRALLGHITALHGSIIALEAQIMATAKSDPGDAPAGDHTGGRRPHRPCHCQRRRRRPAVPRRARLRRLVRPDAAPIRGQPTA